MKRIDIYGKLKWWLEAESNCRHADFQSAALPTELSNHLDKRNWIIHFKYLN